MRIGMTRLTGTVILIGAIFGLVLSLFGLYAFWTIKPSVQSSISDLFVLADRTLDSTEGMLLVMNSSLDQAGQNLSLIRQILNDTAGTIGQSTTTVDETSKMMGENLPQVIADTQEALISMQTTSLLIDDLLTTFSRIPLIGTSLGMRYVPEVPLSESVARVNRSLDPLPQSFRTIQNDMLTASAGLATVQGELIALSRQVADIEMSIDLAMTEVVEYQVILTDVRERLERIENRLPLLVDTSYLAVTIILIWLGISQLGALLHAGELLSRKNNWPEKS